jgi:hypothetical protein
MKDSASRIPSIWWFVGILIALKEAAVEAAEPFWLILN